MFIPYQQLNIAPGNEALILELRYNELVPKLKSIEDDWWYQDFFRQYVPPDRVWSL